VKLLHIEFLFMVRQIFFV